MTQADWQHRLHHPRQWLLAGIVAALSASPAAWAGGGSGPGCQPGEVRAGLIREHSIKPNVNFEVQLTIADAHGHPKDVGPPIVLQGMPDGHGGSKAQLKLTKADGACDARNKTTLAAPTQLPAGNLPLIGAISELSIETVYFDAAAGGFYIGSIMDTVFSALGADVGVRLPDLYADTNGDGSIGPGDVLYSWVDLDVYLAAIPLFAEGDIFNIVNGEVAQLPGMLFSTTPFGFDSAIGAIGTPFTGSGVAFSEHELVADVPEPGSLMLVMLAAGIALLTRRHLDGPAQRAGPKCPVHNQPQGQRHAQVLLLARTQPDEGRLVSGGGRPAV